MGGSGYERFKEGIYDSGSKNTTSLIKPDGSQEPGFSLKYNTGYVKKIPELQNLFIFVIVTEVPVQ